MVRLNLSAIDSLTHVTTLSRRQALFRAGYGYFDKEQRSPLA